MGEEQRDEIGIGAIVGKMAWGVRVGHGATLSIEFGTPRTEPEGMSERYKKGELSLWIYKSSWRIEGLKNAGELGCEDDLMSLVDACHEIDGMTVSSVDTSPLGDLTIAFEGESLIVRSFAVVFDGSEHWMLLSANGSLSCVGHGEMRTERSR